MNLISLEPIFVDCCFIAYGYQMSLIFSFSKKTYSFKIGSRRGCTFFVGKVTHKYDKNQASMNSNDSTVYIVTSLGYCTQNHFRTFCSISIVTMVTYSPGITDILQQPQMKHPTICVAELCVINFRIFVNSPVLNTKSTTVTRKKQHIQNTKLRNVHINMKLNLI